MYLFHYGPWLSIRVLGLMLFSVGVAALLLGLLFAAKPVRWVLETWLLQVLGCMCYSVYAWHGIIMNEMIPPLTSTLADTIRLSAPFVFVTLMLSMLSYRYIEFGHVRAWKELFLIGDGAVAPRTTSIAERSPALGAPAGSHFIQAGQSESRL